MSYMHWMLITFQLKFKMHTPKNISGGALKVQQMKKISAITLYTVLSSWTTFVTFYPGYCQEKML